MSITVSHSATDYVFTEDSARNDAKVFSYSGSTLTLPKTLTLRRVYPKKSSTYVGNARNYVKISWAVADADGVSCPIIWELSGSRRADVAEADVTLSKALLAQAVLDSELDSFFANLALPG
jgi:hypothetical protein